jgi:Tfp pilus assembly protein PilN
LIKINLVREGRAVRGAGAAPSAAAAAVAGPSNLNNIFVVGGAIVGILAGGLWWGWEKRDLSSRRDTVAAKTAEAQRLDAIIKEVEEFTKRKENLQKRIDLINQLKQNQKGPVRIMDNVSKDLPDLVWLDKMTMSGGQITLTGRGLNPNAIANFVENIKNDPLFEEPDLSKLEQQSPNPPVYGFDMSFHFKYQVPSTAATPGSTTTTGTTGSTSTSGTSKP